MDLQKNSVEYAHLTFSAPPSDNATIAASVDLANWTPVTINSDGTGQVLLSGPSVVGSNALLVPSSTQLWIKITEPPETIVRSAGIVNVY